MRINRADRGSATVEFLLLTIPLFIPLVLYLESIHQGSKIDLDAQVFARQIVRAYVTSPSAAYEPGRIQTVSDVFRDSVFQRDRINQNPVVSFICESSPCLTSGSMVTASVDLTSLDGKSKAHAAATETVDGWGHS